MLPPTRLTAPTSAIDLPNAVSTTEKSDCLFSLRSRRAVLPFERLSPFAVSSKGDALTEVMELVRFIGMRKIV